MFNFNSSKLISKVLKNSFRTIDKFYLRNLSNERNENQNFENQKKKLNKNDFDGFFGNIIYELTNLNSDLNYISNWYKKVLEHNLRGGKKIRALSFLNAYQTISDHYLKKIDYNSTYFLAWTIELLQAYLLIADDIMDHSITRRGLICWHKKEEVGMIAINDSFFLEQGVYQIIRKIRNHSSYTDILNLFLETTQKTVYGQSFDLLVCPTKKKVDLSQFSIERYLTIAKYKTSYYSCSLPIRLAFYFSEIRDEEIHKKIDYLMSKVGILLQIQDDYLDAFADPKIIGKIGTDIQDGKCCWPIVMSLKLATNEQKIILKNNFGKDDEICIQNIKNIYKQLNIEQLYKDHEEQLYKELVVLINKLCVQTGLPESIFKFQVDSLYKRGK